MYPKPFLRVKNETKPVEDNLRIKNTTQRNLVTDQSQIGLREQHLNHENRNWDMRQKLK